MPSLTPQEDLLVIEALVECHNTHVDDRADRAHRAELVAAAFAESHGLTLEDALRQRAEIE